MSHSAASGSASKKLPGRVKSGNGGKKEEQTTNGHHHKDNKKEESSSSDDDDDEPIRAPLQLKIEFVNSIMFRQWPLAKKLCQFMLMYEPNNSQAKQYAPLIDYMLTKEESSSSSSSDDDTTDDDDDDSSDSSSSNSSSNEEEKATHSAEAEAPKPVNASQSSKYTNHK